jgi:tRNA (Thr-GGU) A37 N-methylase
MLGLALSFLLKGFGFGKMLLGWVWDFIKGVASFAMAKPFQFLTIVLSLALIGAAWYGFNTKKELVETQQIVEEKVLFIKGQDRVLKEYVTALKVEKQNHVASINRSNEAVARLKRVADNALARAQAAGVAAKKDQQRYNELAEQFGRINPSSGAPEERIEREERTNDEFIGEWKKAAQ